MLRRSRATPADSARPMPRPVAVTRRAVPQHHPEHVAGLCPKSHADADLAGALRDQVALHPVQANRGEQQRKRAERGEERGAGANQPQHQARVAMLGKRPRGQHGERRIDRVELPPNRSDDRWRRVTALRDAHVEGHRGTRIAAHRKIDVGRGDPIEQVVSDAGHDADDLPRRLGRGGRVPCDEAERLAHGIPVGPQPPCERLVDHDGAHAPPTLFLRPREPASPQHRQSQRREVVGADDDVMRAH